ncbi:nitrous oxide reductase family maturation protein NosD [Neisseria lisongii]|uniref:Nitrous oxide reductase family maturation protein NosD n=1 Tax=Neisseria lisongii TaxID=2912188 RepID=A0AAW5AMK4_9NEIS|nr:nitrous oxide reductase family maturation protein NosD [Neisseria lisongii]MCF7530449.1 nitrous oxide reductase family maturation protein NosD [Neisseria lisongii]
MSVFHSVQSCCTALLLAAYACFQTASAAVIDVSPKDDLAEIVKSAAAGDVLRLASGKYAAKLYLDKTLTLEGPTDGSAVIEGDGSGRTIDVRAPNVVLRQLTITRSGMNLAAMDAGVYLEETAVGAVVENNRILENSVGVFIHGAKDALVRNNRIVGDSRLRVNERGNGVTVWNAPGAKVIGNDISKGRDGIFSNTSTFNIYRGNRFSDLRFAVHYMYTNDSEVSDNISIGNNIGYALMFSERLKVSGNIAVNSRDQGIMLNYVNQSEIADNIIYKADKCVFFYNANYNQIHGNYFERCAIGIHFTAAIEGTVLQDNSFVNNESQVKYVSTRFLDWAEGGRGNYWSDNSAFDLDGDGFGDNAYRPNGITDQIIWRAPVARLLMNSPAMSVVKWAQAQFPAILPGGVIDSKPLMEPYQNPTMPKYLNIKTELEQSAAQPSAWAGETSAQH